MIRNHTNIEPFKCFEQKLPTTGNLPQKYTPS
jgi:hypothetical protein